MKSVGLPGYPRDLPRAQWIFNSIALYGKKLYLRNCVTQLFLHIFDIFEAREGLEGLKLDEIEAANSFPMLPKARR